MATVGVTEPIGVVITVDESADAAESNEFIDIVDLNRREKEGKEEKRVNLYTLVHIKSYARAARPPSFRERQEEGFWLMRERGVGSWQPCKPQNIVCLTIVLFHPLFIHN